MNLAKASIIPSSDNWDVFALQAYESASKHAAIQTNMHYVFEIVRYNEIDELPQPSSCLVASVRI